VHKKTSFFIVVVLSLVSSASPERDLFSDTWVAAELPGYEECGPVRAGKTVGIFYFL
jgi:hypothetical protein